MQRTPTDERGAYLLKKNVEKTLTKEEEDELYEWLLLHFDKKVFSKHVEEVFGSFGQNENDRAVAYEQMYHNILLKSGLKPKNEKHKVTRTYWARWSMVASFALLFGLLVYVFTNHPSYQEETKGLSLVSDVSPPSSVNAVLTLSNGQKIILDSAGKGTLAKQGAVNVMKLDSSDIAYFGQSTRLEYNSIYNPPGSKVIHITLSDGTRVWLNTDSYLRYPASFMGEQREVEVAGEAYFEVAHKKNQPFIVRKGSASIEVFGTSFNVNSYDDESTMTVTLLTGSVSVSSSIHSRRVTMTPGQQAQWLAAGEIQVNNDADVEEVLAWKNANFLFKGTRLEEIMRQVSRWYNVEVVFENKIQEKFYAEVSRNTGVSTLLQMMEATGVVQFTIDGRKIIVSKK